MDVEDIFKKLSAGAVFKKRPSKSSKHSSPDLSQNDDEAVEIVKHEVHSTTSVAKEKTKKSKKTKIIEVERVSVLGHW